MKILNLLWLLPFFSFLLGYFFISQQFQVPYIETPSLVGKDINQALIILSEKNINPRILDQKEESVLPSGTILSQTPHAGEKIKPYQSIFLVISKKKPTQLTPNLLGTNIIDIKKKLTAMGIRFKVYYLENNYPRNHCFAQFPASGEQCSNNHMIIYISTTPNTYIVWPDFTKTSFEKTINFLKTYNIEPQIIFSSLSHSQSSHIIEQRPLAGTLLSFNENTIPLVQIRVE